MASAGKRNASNRTIPKATPTRHFDPKRNIVNEVLAVLIQLLSIKWEERMILMVKKP